MRNRGAHLLVAALLGVYLAACEGALASGGGAGAGGADSSSGSTTRAEGGSGSAGTTSTTGGAGSASSKSSASSGGSGAPSCSSSGGATACTPGAVEACPCGDAGTGTRTCDPAGAGFLACACPPPLACTPGAACPGAWCKAFPEGDGQSNFPQGFVADTEGRLLLLNDQDNALAVVKLDPSGAKLATIDVDTAVVIGATPDGGFVIAGDPNDPYHSTALRAQRYDREGKVVFDRSFAATAVFVSAIATDAAGDTFVAGAFVDAIDFGCFTVGPADNSLLNTFVVKLDPAGNPLWGKQVITGTDGEYDGIHSLSVDPAGNLVIVGQGAVDDVVDFGAGPVLDSAAGSGESDVLVAELDPSGAPLWAKRYGRVTLTHILGKVDGQGNVVAVGNAFSPIDFGGGPIGVNGANGAFVARFDTAGNYLSSFETGALHVNANDFAIDPSGNIVIAGDCGGNQDNWQACVSRWTPTGTKIAGRKFGDAAVQEAFFVALDGAGTPTFAGPFTGTMDVGSGPVTDPNGGQNESTYVARALLP